MEDHKAIMALLADYFAGLYAGDVDKLRSVFHPQAALFAELGGVPYRKSLDAYLDGVAERQSPAQRGESYRMRVLSINVLHNIATARVHVPALGFNFYNFLSLVRLDGQWLIVNKSFTDLPS